MKQADNGSLPTDTRLEAVEAYRHLQAIAETLQQQQSQLTERYEWLEAMINHVPDFIYAKDLQGRFLFANHAIVANNGFDSVEELIGLTDFDIHPSTAARDIAEVERQVMEHAKPDLGIEERRLKGEGWLMMSRVPLRDRAGNVIGIVGASRDITARKRAEELMKAHAALLRDVATGVDLKTLMANLTGVLKGLLPGCEPVVILDGPAQSHRAIEASEFVIRSRDGRRHGALLAPVSAHDDGGIREFLTGIAQTIGIAIDRHHDAERISHLAEHDALTGLPNRTTLDFKLQALLEDKGQDASPVAVAFVDLDHFKLVNDSLGHVAGDELLKLVAERIRAQVGQDGLVSRVGGDEFIVVLTPTSASFERRLADLRNAISTPLSVSGMELTVTCSIGVACSGTHGNTTAELFVNADMALYRVKESGRNGVTVFSPALADEARHKLARIEELRRAVERDEFVLHYQPQKQIGTGKVTGVEALVRWNHPTMGLVYPGEFIPIAEETGLILPIGEAILKKACLQAREWQDRGLDPIKIAVNVSARQFREPSLTRQISAALNAADLDARWLEIEVTESLIMQDVEGAIARMHELKELGVTLSIDDFGTGYSSLSTLKLFPLSRLKIDRSFIADIPTDAGDMAITRAILALAKLLELEVVAEGVETADQAAFLRDAGCDFLQGYLLSRPLPEQDIQGFLAAH